MRDLPRPGSGTTAMGRYRTCLSYLQALYGKLDDGWISLWRKRDKRSGWVHVQDLRSASITLGVCSPNGRMRDVGEIRRSAPSLGSGPMWM